MALGLAGGGGLGLGTVNVGGGGGSQKGGGGATAGPPPNQPNTPGALGVGGDTYRDQFGSGAGGGGYYGGGAGYDAGGGGGSSYIGGLTNASTMSGVRSGYGMIVISW